MLKVKKKKTFQHFKYPKRIYTSSGKCLGLQNSPGPVTTRCRNSAVGNIKYEFQINIDYEL